MLLAAAFMSISVFAQKISTDKVPSSVLKAFQSKFPGAADPTWELEHEKDYEVNFKINSARHSAVFDSKGNWLESESKIKVSELPAAVKESIIKQFPGFKVEEAENYEDAEHGSCYEVEIEKGKETFDILIKANGEIIKKTVETEKEKGEEEDKD